MSCMPTGRPSSSKPQGTASDGRPVSDGTP
jgi:hypothetical protein